LPAAGKWIQMKTADRIAHKKRLPVVGEMDTNESGK
jgi:hypothetical protein